MRIFRLAEILELKYKFGAIAPKEQRIANLERFLKSQILSLKDWAHDQYTVLDIIANAQFKKTTAETENDTKAIAGEEFCKKVLMLVDFIQSLSVDNLGKIREVSTILATLIEQNRFISFGEEKSKAEFQHVSAAIFEKFPHSTKHDRLTRDSNFNFAKKQLSRILSISISMRETLDSLEVAAPERFTHETTEGVDINAPSPGRFPAQRMPLSHHDIIKFIRHSGPEYGISTTEDWATVLYEDPVLKEQMTTVINAISRGHSPRDKASVKMQIAQILKEFEERKSSNMARFEGDPSAQTASQPESTSLFDKYHSGYPSK